MVLGLPDPSVRGTDLRIRMRIRTRTNMLRIRNTVCLNNKSCCNLPATARRQQSRYASCQVPGSWKGHQRQQAHQQCQGRLEQQGRQQEQGSQKSSDVNRSRNVSREGRRRNQEHQQVKGHQLQQTRQSLSSSCKGSQRQQEHQRIINKSQQTKTAAPSKALNITRVKGIARTSTGVAKDFSSGKDAADNQHFRYRTLSLKKTSADKRISEL